MPYKTKEQKNARRRELKQKRNNQWTKLVETGITKIVGKHAYRGRNEVNRQIKKYLRGAPIPKEMEGLLAIVDDAYNHYEENHKLLQRALELSSIELNQAKNRISEALGELNEKNNYRP